MALRTPSLPATGSFMLKTRCWTSALVPSTTLMPCRSWWRPDVGDVVGGEASVGDVDSSSTRAFFRSVWSPWKNFSVMPEFFTLAVPL